MKLRTENLKNINAERVIIPAENLLTLPEKVLQFGTGVLLRGLPDYFIDKANGQGIFNGRVVIVKSTGNGDTSDFDEQDSLYTIGVRGIENGEDVNENIISSAISRVISAEKDWSAILEVAKSPELKIIISNTTEVGIQLVNESVEGNPPASFPAKLLSVLYQRYHALGGAAATGMVIIATELIPENGKKLESIVYELAEFNKLDTAFVDWSRVNNIFCNSLVDRIVPGKPDALKLAELKEDLGYEDSLLILAEPYRLWAVEGNEAVAETLSFMQADKGLIVKPDIEIYRELKVRLLNGTHTLTSGIACLSGIDTVKNGMDNTLLRDYVAQVMRKEIAPAIPYEVSLDEALNFADSVIDRFANPHIKHLWLSITMQYAMKMKIRVVPVLFNYFKITGEIPSYITFGFAAFLHFMRATKQEGAQYYGSVNGKDYLINDDQAAYFYNIVSSGKEDDYVKAVLNDQDLWGADFNEISSFVESVQNEYNTIREKGITAALKALNTNLKAVN